MASLEALDELTFTAVPPVSGERIGIDQDLDCLPDGVDPTPQKSTADANGNGVPDSCEAESVEAGAA